MVGMGRGRGRAPRQQSAAAAPGGLPAPPATKTAAAEEVENLPGGMAGLGLTEKERSMSGSSGLASGSPDTSPGNSLPDVVPPRTALGRGRGRGLGVHQPRKPDPAPVPLNVDSSLPDHTSTESSGAPDGAVWERKRELSVGGPVATAVMAPGTKGRRTEVSTNLYDFTALGGAVHRYRLDMESLNLRTNSAHDMGKGAGNDHLLNKKREICFIVLDKAKHQHPEIFGDPRGVAYDRRNLVYAIKAFTFPGGQEEGDLDVDMGPGELPGSDDAHRFRLRFQYESKVDISDLSGLTKLDLEMRNREVVQILETILAQQPYQLQEHLVHFGAKSYERKPAKFLGNGRYLSRGMHRSCQPTTDKDGNAILSVVVDNKNAAFYTPQLALQTLGEVLAVMSRRPRPFTEAEFKDYTLSVPEVKHASAYFRDVNVRDHTTKRPLTVSGLSLKPAAEIVVKYVDGKRGGLERDVNLVTLYKEQFKHTIRFPRLQCFVQRCKGGAKKYFPIEVCSVNENQRVPLVKQTPDMMQQMIRESALKPSDLKREVENKVRASKLLSNEILAAFGLQISEKARVVQGLIVPKPDIKYAQGGAKVDGKGDWKMARNRFVSAGHTKGWAVIVLCPIQNHHIPQLQQFTANVVQDAHKKGLMLPKPAQDSVDRFDQVENKFDKAARNGCDFLMFIVGDDKQTYVKDRIKLYEATKGIITQCVTLKKALDIGKNERGAWQVTENILNKTNMKLGGINYELAVGPQQGGTPKWLQKGKVMLLGCDVNHPPPQPASQRHLPPREPSVVGFVANQPDRPLLFTGEISYQGAREEMVAGMGGLASEMFRRWCLKAPSLPEEIVYFRDGVSDGQFAHVLRQEVEAIRSAYKRHPKASKNPAAPKITVLVAKKRHNFRMLGTRLNERDRASAQDLEPGTALDSSSGVTHPGQANFFLKSHTALQGTARATHYTVLLNEAGYEQDGLNQLVFGLAHNHQIVSKSVSLPAPVYGAHEMAERGKRLYRALAELELDGTASEVTPSDSAEPVDLDALNRRLRVGQFAKLFTAKHWA